MYSKYFSFVLSGEKLLRLRRDQFGAEYNKLSPLDFQHRHIGRHNIATTKPLQFSV